MVQRTGQGTRRWNKDQIAELLTTGKVKGFEGHHINSVDWALNNTADPLSWIRNPANINFMTRAEHQVAHANDFANWTTGELLNRLLP